MKSTFDFVKSVLKQYGLFKEADAQQYQKISQSIFNKPVNWANTNDDEFPYTAVVDGQIWKLRINGDFPEEDLYTLLINEKPVLTFTEKSSNWVFIEKNVCSNSI